MLVFVDGMDLVTEAEIREHWPDLDGWYRQRARYIVCKPEHQQYFELIGMEFVDDLSDTEQ